MKMPAFIDHWRARPDLAEVRQAEARAIEQGRKVDEVMPQLLDAMRKNHFADRIAAKFREERR